jgi:hypothetical protein
MNRVTALALWTQARLVARAWGVRVERSPARAVFGETVVVAEYIAATDAMAPCIVVYEQGVVALAKRHALTRRTVENRAILHELTHHAATWKRGAMLRKSREARPETDACPDPVGREYHMV